MSDQVPEAGRLAGYENAYGEFLTMEEATERIEAHRWGPSRLRILCACGFEAWGDDLWSAREAVEAHRNEAVGYPLTLTMPPDDLPLLHQCLADLREADDETLLPELYAARKRGLRPMRLWLYGGGRHKAVPGEKALPLFEAAGPERDPKSEG